MRSTLVASVIAALLACGLGIGESTTTVLAQTQASADDEGPGVVNINTASAEELMKLPGIGASRAAAIIGARQRRAFRRTQEIMRVHGIGRATFRRLAPMLTVEGPTTLR